MGKTIEFTIPLPPSVNHLYGNRCIRGRVVRYISDKGKQWFEEAGWELKRQVKKRKPITTPISIYIRMYHCRSRDIDNVLKATFDLLEKMRVIENDNQIEFLQIWKIKVEKMKDQRLEIEVSWDQ